MKKDACPDESATIRSAAQGDKEAYRKLVESHQDRLFHLVLSMVSRREQAEDLVQEIFVKAYFALPSFSGGSAFYTWLFRIAANHCLDHLRRKNPATVSLDAPPHPESDTNGVEYLAAPQIEEPETALQGSGELAGVLRRLSPEQRLILSLRELEGYSYEELATTLGCEVNTVKSRLNRARAALKAAYENSPGNISPAKHVEEGG